MEILHSNILGTGSRNIIILHGFLGMGSNWKTHSKRWELIGHLFTDLQRRQNNEKIQSFGTFGWVSYGRIHPCC